MKFLLALAFLFTSVSAYGADVTTKVMIPEDAAGCLLDADDTVNHIHGKPVPGLGVLDANPSCFDGWSSGVDFTNGWEAVRLGKVSKDCDKKTFLYTTLDLSPGRKGFLETFVAQPTTATNPCIANGVVYRKYDAFRDE